MKTLRLFIQVVLLMITIQQSSAQIGYQVSLLNSATGEPRIAETVEVKITLTNNEGTIIHEETQTETTNDFGILSLAIGNSTTFDDVDWTKLPFFISVSVDGKLVGKSQVLTVPVAEYAKKTGTLTKELLCSKNWKCEYYMEESIVYVFFPNNTGKWYRTPETGSAEKDGDSFSYFIVGNDVVIFSDTDTCYGKRFIYVKEKNALVDTSAEVYK